MRFYPKQERIQNKRTLYLMSERIGSDHDQQHGKLCGKVLLFSSGIYKQTSYTGRHDQQYI